ncbi:Lysophosphatidic acid acyltransferase endophilin/SH3GL, involved in synaptic vesicle formation [Handroanthus impetiginosus]|uniref:Lysophosphatidic acid acyltransferase endophilin/SH3GL, involved in synaptic vesicle formation n=1 Tax=Handroanthus impetiginosus TaxID=429701 RepID=A0A2G9GFI4_9LAMI|nr:Lysophosphatidic acid acyltransferase endophilin/SH3GL, involved in synaptic vesicle formation [Handroanthus impetiginosus]PIN13829.1 Lysophosphatidic acid acyltransferase endophilin/SH3GL, involved in synaptic vesicle formation [Handroanthus impetiginosus]
MDALRKQASKFREQVAKQQQAVIKQFGGSGYETSDIMVIDEVEMQTHQQLEKLYRSTRSGRDFQKDIVKAAEAFTAVGYKHIEAGTKLSEDCSKYGVENVSDEVLSKAASAYGDARKHVEKEQEEFNRLLFTQVLEPLRAMITGTPLEDARHLAQRYSKMRQEAEAQAAEVSRRQARVRESPIPENVAKLHAAETRMQELKANMAVLGKEAAAALAAVESQQHRLTFQRLVAMVEGERIYHERVATILGNIEAEMVSEKQRKEAAPPVAPVNHTSGKTKYFLAEVMHAFDAASEKELTLSVGDYVVVRKVSPSGWSEGECKGRAGWFPTAYVEKRQRIPTNYTATEVY